jgi:hypothetical protein
MRQPFERCERNPSLGAISDFRAVDREPTIASSISSVRARRLDGIAVALLVLTGCEIFRSDSENAQRRARAERQERLAGMRAATSQTPAGRYLEGRALTDLLSGRTHVSEFQQDPSGRRTRYVEYRYYAAGGRFVYVNNEWAVDPAGNADDHWRVDGPRLCVLNHAFTDKEQCYTVAVAPDGAVQFFIDEPGSESHGLLTSVVRFVYDGPPRAER